MPLEKKYQDLLAAVVPEAGLDAEKLEEFSRLFDLILQTNEKLNITSITAPLSVVLKHFADSLALFGNAGFRAALEKAEVLCDIGCGGGFPGLPIAIAAPEKKIVMVDSTEKKIHALCENAASLSLSRVVPVWGRGEELAGKGGELREAVDLCFSRAVARFPVLCELCLPFVKPGGVFFALKGMKAPEELEEARAAIPRLGGKLLACQKVEWSLPAALPGSFTEEEKREMTEFFTSDRYLILVRKIKSTPSAYPRKWAQMTKRPLG